MPSQKNTQSSPGVSDSYFEWSDSWRTLEKIFGSQVILPGQFGNCSQPEDPDLRDGRALACALMLNSLQDLEEAIDREWGIRTGTTYPFTDRREVEDWIFNDVHMEDVIIDGKPAIPETQAFESPVMPQRLTLEVDSDGTFSFKGACSLLSMDYAAIRRKVRSWIYARDSGLYIPLTAGGAAAFHRSRAMARIHQAKEWKKAGYPHAALVQYLPPRLCGPAPTPKQVPTATRKRQDAQIRQFAARGMDNSAIALSLGVSDRRVRYVLKPRASRAKAANEALKETA